MDEYEDPNDGACMCRRGKPMRDGKESEMELGPSLKCG